MSQHLLDGSDLTLEALGVPTESVGFPFEEVFERLDGPAPKQREPLSAEAAAALGEVFRWACEATTLQAVALRFLVLTAGVRPDLLGNRTLKEIGEAFNVTKQNVSHTLTLAQSHFGIVFARSQSIAARRHQADVMRLSHLRRKIEAAAVDDADESHDADESDGDETQ